MLKEKKFNDTVKDLTVFVEKKKSNGEMLNIFLRDDTSSGQQSKTIIAKRGHIVNKEDQNILVLFDGTIQTEKKNKKINFLNFDKTEINLSSFSTKTITFPKIQERDTVTLLNCIVQFADESKVTLEQAACKTRIDDVAAELNRRFGMPLYIPLISIIICYLLSSRKESKYSFLQGYIVFFWRHSFFLVLAENHGLGTLVKLL